MATFTADTTLEGLDLLTVASALEHYHLPDYMATFTTRDYTRCRRLFNRQCLRCLCLCMSQRGDGRVQVLAGVKAGTLIVHNIEPRGSEQCSRCTVLPEPIARK